MCMLQKIFGFNKQTMNLRTEIIAGITTFLTMSYILAVNPAMLSTTGMDKGAIFTATALAAAIATLLLAWMAKLPFAQAPGMGLNAFFAFTLVQGMGYSWETALAAMFVEGLIFILITLLNVREIILNSIPVNLRHAISAGIGMFIAFIGLKNAGESFDVCGIRAFYSYIFISYFRNIAECRVIDKEGKRRSVLQYSFVYDCRHTVRSHRYTGKFYPRFHASFHSPYIL